MSERKVLSSVLDTLGNIDFSTFSAEKNPSDLSKKAGLKLISTIINSIIGDNQTYFFEYSIIASSINPETRKLFSFSCLQERKEDALTQFKDNVQKYVNNIINELYPSSKDGIDTIQLLSENWFHNPEMFLFPTLESIKPYHVYETVDIEDNAIQIKESRDEWICDSVDQEHDGKHMLLYKNMTCPRSFDEMIAASKLIVERYCETNESELCRKLVAEYHQGAKKLKSYYDHYISEGKNFGYITFPIISAYNTYLDDYFKTIFGKQFQEKHAVGIGHFFLYYKYDNVWLSEEKINQLFIDINQAVNHIALSYVFSTGISLTRKARREAIKAAKAAIMSRNMSHNLGSHVMFYIKQRLQSVQKIVDTGALKYLVNANSLEELKKCISIGESEMPFLVGLGRFINYLQERQDYIATIATDYIPYKSAINFKDAIYDELKPELRFQRHYTKETKDTSMEGKQAANLLLDYIAYSEGFKKSDQIELLFEDFDGTGRPSEVPSKLRQFNIALPGGNLGRQAFFSIMENIIRNTAKHDGTNLPLGSKLRFRFNLLDNFDFFKLYAWTNKEVYSANVDNIIETYKAHNKDFYYLGITVDIDKEVEDNTLDKIKKGLCNKYLDDDGRMNEDSKGIKEIRISAAWMRGYGIDTDIPNSEPPAVAISNNNNKLQYIICLPKPKKIAIVGNKSTQLDENGIQFFRSEGLNNDNYGLLADFEMIVCSKGDADKLRSSVGSRILIIDDIKNDDDIKFKVNADSIYMRWLHEKFGLNLPKLIINDDKSYNYKNFTESNTKGVDKDLLNDDLVKCNSADSESDQIVYSKHYEGQNEISMLYKNATFLEGVSGGNSTDRLIRQEPWTKEWYVKQMTAGLTKIAIFDERIHSSFVKQGENTAFADWNVEKLRSWLTKLVEEKGTITSGFIQDNLNKEFKGLVNYKDVGERDSNLNFATRTDDETLEKVINKLHSVVSDADYSIAALFAQKGIVIFDIYSNDETITIKGYSEKENKDVNVAEIKMNKDSKKVECIPINSEFLKKFHFVVIHQGILDKIYETLGIKSIEQEDVLIEKKKEVTSELFDKFSFAGERTTDGFLPQFIIHSGRSRPTDKDMPQKQPFIQFAALDHAIRDCKHTLTELLYSAHYE